MMGVATAARVLLSVTLAIVLAGSPVLAEKRVALVIGNGAYTKVPMLPNPGNDARSMAALLDTAGFDVVDSRADLGSAAFRKALREFSDAVRDADVAVVFYAGHGMEMNGVNYLLPVDATVARDVDLEDEAVTLDRVVRTLEPAKKLQLVILDACRDNPFVRSMKRTAVSRSVRSGYGEIDERSLPPNTLIAYAQRAGATADDGIGSNSPYTTALLKHLVTPGLDVELALRRVRDEVLRSTKNKQEPFKYGSLGGAELPLLAAKAAEPAPAIASPAPARMSEAAEAWSLIKDTRDLSALEAFVRRYGDTFYGDLAKGRLDELKRTQTAALARQPEVEQKKSAEPAAAAPSRRCTGQETEVDAATGPQCIEPGSGVAFRDCPDCPEMVVAPAGKFTMGSPASEEGRFASETQVSVSIAAPFAAGRLAVTRGEFAAFVKATGHKAEGCYTWTGSDWKRQADKSWRSVGFAQDDRHPVVCVSWHDAKAYVAWLSNRTGKAYRLLSEAEHEYVTRAGTTGPFWWGSQISTEQANYNGNYIYGAGQKGEYRMRTVTADSFKPNPWGLYNVHGNVGEWMEDCWNDKNDGNPGDGTARDSGDCHRRMARSGSWNGKPVALRSGFRQAHPADDRMTARGFRVARTLSPP